MLLSMFLTGVVAVPMASAQTAMDPNCLGEYNAVANGCTVPAGTIALTEVVDRANGEIYYTYGKLETDFVVSQDHNAWVIDSLEKASSDAVSTAEGRLSDPAYAGYMVYLNGEEFGSDGSSGSSEGSFTLPSREVEVSDELRLGDTVKEVGQNPEVVTFPAGAVLVERVTDSSEQVIHIDLVVLEEDTSIEVGPGMRAVHIWYNYQDQLHGSRDACREANARFLETLTEGNWNYMYLVFLNGEQMTAPADCS